MKKVYYYLERFYSKDGKTSTPNSKVVSVLFVDDNKKQWKGWEVPIQDFISDNIDADEFIPVVEDKSIILNLQNDGYTKAELDIWK